MDFSIEHYKSISFFIGWFLISWGVTLIKGFPFGLILMGLMIIIWSVIKYLDM